MRIRTGSVTTRPATPVRFEMRPCPVCENDRRRVKPCGVCNGMGYALQPVGALATCIAHRIKMGGLP